MNKIKLDDDESYIKIIKELLLDFDSYIYIIKEIDIILKTIDNDIDYIILNDDDIYVTLEIHLCNEKSYGFNYDGKNYPLISFFMNKLIIHSIDTIIETNDELIINIFDLDIKNFKKIE